MSEQEQEQEQTTQAPAEESTFKAPQTQDELNALVRSRLDRERAKFADYEDLKAKAEKFDEAENAAKSEAEKAVERAEKAEKALADREAAEAAAKERAEAEEARKKLVGEVAAAKGVPANLLFGATRDELEAHADVLAEYAGKGRRNVVRTAGTRGEGSELTGVAAGRERASARSKKN